MKITILILWFYSLFLFSQVPFSVIPSRICSDNVFSVPFCLGNPLNLRNISGFNGTFFVTPSKFLISELNSIGSAVFFSLPSELHCQLILEYLGSKKFSYSSFNIDLQREFWEKFNFASSFSLNMFTVESFGKKLKLNWAVYFEYLYTNDFAIAFSFKNIFNSDFSPFQLASIGIKHSFSKSLTFGFISNIYLNKFVTYNLFATFLPFESLFCDVNVQTNPQSFTIGFGCYFDDIILSIFLQYNNLLSLSQTLCISLKF